MADTWFTDDVPPRPLVIKGRSGVDPDCLVAENPDGGSRPLWIIDDGATERFVEGAK